MLITLAVIGGLVVLAVVFRLSGIKLLRVSFTIGGDDDQPKLKP